MGERSLSPPLEIHEISLGDEIPELNPLKHITGGHNIENGQASGHITQVSRNFFRMLNLNVYWGSRENNL